MITYYHPPPKPITPAHGYQLPAKDRRRLVRTGRELKPHALPSDESTPVTTSNRFAVLGDDSNTTTLTVVEKSHMLYIIRSTSVVSLRTPQRMTYENTWRLRLYHTRATLLMSVSSSPKRGTTQSQFRSASVWGPLLPMKLHTI